MLNLPLQTLLLPVVNGLGYELLGIERIGQGKRGVLLRVYIDHPDGITLDDCEKVSNQISGVLDVEDPIASQYTLEVSSPGLDRPLFTLEHFARFCGSQAQVRLTRPLENRRKWVGIITAVDTERGHIELRVDQASYTLSFDQIERARLEPTNEEIQALLKAQRN